MELVVDFFLDGVCRSMAYGRYPDPGARNRGISRPGALNPAGPGMAEDLYHVAHHRREELRRIADIRRGQVEPYLRYTNFFWHSEYFIHQRPDWFASVRMHSARNHNMEQPHNEEGLLNHHYADGPLRLVITPPVKGRGDHWRVEYDEITGSSRITLDLPREEWAGRSVVLEGFNAAMAATTPPR